MATLRPTTGQWYQTLSDKTLFEVIAWDRHNRTIEVQYLDGEITGYDLETWQNMALAPAAPPEDWRVPFEIDGDDSADPDAPFHPECIDPLAGIEPESYSDMAEF